MFDVVTYKTQWVPSKMLSKPVGQKVVATFDDIHLAHGFAAAE